MAHSTKATAPRKPYPDFPLTPRTDGRWCKKVWGTLHTFSGTAQEALDEWNRVKDDLYARRTPRVKADGLTMGDLCNRFLTAKQQQRDGGEITARHWKNYKATTDRLISHFGKNRLVTDLASEDFESLRAAASKTLGPVSLGNLITHIRVVFKYGYDAGLIDRPVRYGPLFKRPSKKVLRLARAEKGKKLFTADQIQKMIKKSDGQLGAMILLAVNCGFGNSDVGTMPLSSLDLVGGWLNYHRPKTGIDRRCSLWPETVAALKKVLADRPTPKQDDAAELVFVTKYGASWAKETTDNPITKEFRKLLDDLSIHRAGLGFYSLRHTFRTIADESRDQPACNSIMGHADASIADAYREHISDERLRAVADHVRNWLYAKLKKASRQLVGNRKSNAAQKPRNVKPASRPRQVSAEDSPQLRVVG